MRQAPAPVDKSNQASQAFSFSAVCLMKISLRQIRVGMTVLSLMLVSGLAGFKLGSKNFQPVSFEKIDNSQVNLSLFWQVWDKLGESYLIKENLKPQEMVWGAIKGMTASLGDPYTVFLPPEDNQSTKEELNGAFEGVGIELGFKDKTLAVVAPLAGMPAEAAGIKAADYILHIKDELKGVDVETTDMSLPEAVKLIRGKKGTEVELTVLHDGETETKVIKVRRDTIVIKSVVLEWQGENKDVAWLKLSRFGDRTQAEWDETVGEILKHQQLKGIILDLRNNPGGYLNGAVALASEFLRTGQIVVRQESAKGKTETFSVSKAGRLLTQPLVVLVNKGSASSSEILSGALRDSGRAKLIGEKTFGKGTIQEALDVGESAGLHVTTAKWLLPSGQWVNETKGITPDISIQDNKETAKDEVIEKALENL
ncbi:MAG: Carboxyl-terminal protease [Candidatus Beckwithbacteria bacterium GW2011_GWA2_43_10]|uniref:Carboxyl-terminal protease n=1 Tax=Candidatus Beckwithbacteria bacterium GW2011_GWA2_43_10 TaxID=1618369 RepID=A0A0G1E835_9BACT|nr:MAG: Carboxyl-terminal protease [Candidatus Beckwithbacteria bacterium GW2011_GWA2_43_10]